MKGISRSALYRVLAWGTCLSAVVIACSSERPRAGDDGNLATPPGVTCGTPQEGCPCDAPAAEVDCGKLEQRSGSYVLCALGKRTCMPNKTWGGCASSTLQPRWVGPGLGGLAPQVFLGACPTNPANPLSNVCDPYCTQYQDDPLTAALEGGVALGLPDGSAPGDGGDAGGPTGFQSTATGNSTCPPASNLGGTTCTNGPGEFAQCKQDFRCAAGTCVWNGGAGYFDPTAGGPDLTVGAPCGPSGSATSTVPVCNRGSVAVAAGATITFHQTNGAPPNPCTNLGTPTFSFPLAAALNPGECTTFSVGNSAGNKEITVNAGLPGAQPVNEAPNRCANNTAFWKTDGAGNCAACQACNTRVSGTVYDPGQNVPLTGVTVFQPSGTLTPLTDGVQCDNCPSLESPSVTKIGTQINGSFVLPNVTPGPATRIVVQSGRWRREITTPVTACVDNPKPAGTFRMPRNSGEGNIPKMAVVMGDQETLECMFRKLGVDAAEIQPRGSGGRIQLWQSGNGMVTTPAAPNVSGLTGSTAVLNEYSAIFFDCDGGDAFGTPYSQAATAAQKTNLRNYTNIGGKLFLDHFEGDLVRTGPAPENAITTWQTGSPAWYAHAYNGFFSPIGDEGRVQNTSPAQQQMHDWLNGPAAAMTDYGAPYIRIDQPKRHALTPDPARTVQWIRGQSTDNWAGQPGGDYSNSFSYETPIAAANCGQPNGRGRVIYNGMHVSGSRHSGGGFPGGKAFPTSCNLGASLTPEEKALEYQIFQLTACTLGGGAPPPDPPPPPLPVVYYQVDYEGQCAEGTGAFPEWTWVFWQSLTPVGTKIDFHVATADTQAALPAGPPVVGPDIIHVGEASGAPVLPPAWATHTTDGPIATQLENEAFATPKSKRWLRLFMTFNPVGAVPPTLTGWRVQYSCKPQE